ncbi:MAG: UvrD-helicase domain-containing protein [Gemmatimonadota bacterium]
MKSHPASKGVDYETYTHARDPKFRTARLTDSLRALIWQLDGETLLVWDVATHEEAKRQSARSICRVSALTQSLEICMVDERVSDTERNTKSGSLRPLVPPNVSDADLRRMGLSDDMIAVSRGITDSESIEALARLLPACQKQLLAVRMLADGESPEIVYREVAALPDYIPDHTDYTSALVRSIRDGRLEVLASEEQLSNALLMPWEAWKSFLLPEQRSVAYAPRYNGPVRVTGGPGTGKTVVAIHRVRALVDGLGLLRVGQPILLTTYVKTLVDQLAEMTSALLGAESTGLVRVVGIDKLVSELLKHGLHSSRGFAVLDDAGIDSRIGAMPYDAQLNMTPQEIRKFWENVLLAMVVPSWDEYQRLRKRVRGVRSVNQGLFTQLVRLAEALETQLVKERKTTFLLRVRDCLDLPAVGNVGYQHVVVDEAQDMHPLHWRLLRRLVPSQPNDIFLVADADQRLYRTPFPLAYCGVDVTNRTKRLKKSYRCSMAILTLANRLLEGVRAEDPDDDGSERGIAASLFSGPEPRLSGLADHAAEYEGLANRLLEWHTNGIAWPEMLVMCPTNARCSEVVTRLATRGVPAGAVGTVGVLTGSVRVMTMYRAKGMEAKVAAVIGVSAAEMGTAGFAVDELERKRHVLFVACTRARQDLYVSWSGERSSLLAPLFHEDGG